ncbi:mechanosensitive ion channel family protein [Fretibacter rubidus]|uniref:mechanosensitive ion channel family protein n=1 Tax=Fretibacter rubidus TaxID=570162 RepID=UPI00352B432A
MKFETMMQATPSNNAQDTGLMSSDNDLAFVADIQAWAIKTWDQLLSLSTLWQLLTIVAVAILGWLLSRRPRQRLETHMTARDTKDIIYRILNALQAVVWPIITVIFLWLSMFVYQTLDRPAGLIRITASLTNAAIIVRLLTRNMTSGPVKTALAWSAWGIAALYILRWLDPLTTALERASFPVGDHRISVLQILTSVIVASFALWIGRIAGDAAQTQVQASRRLTPSMAGLLGQVAKIGLLIIAIIIALGSVGIPLTAFAVLSGGIGVGLGFGLQAIFSNFISGIIILFERSVKVGDFIELQSGVRGQVREINIRSTLVTTNDSVDILVPNEEFIKAQVINWTLRDPRRRLRVPFGVAYGSDKELVKKAGLEAAEAVEWTETDMPNSAPAVWLTEFGDSSLNFALVVWLKDSAVKRPSRVEADYNWALHTALEKYNLEIPFPQRDINIRQPAEISVTMKK